MIEHLSQYGFQTSVRRYDREHKVRGFSGGDQLLTTAFPKLPYREGLRDIETCLPDTKDRLCHTRIRGHAAMLHGLVRQPLFFGLELHFQEVEYLPLLRSREFPNLGEDVQGGF